MSPGWGGAGCAASGRGRAICDARAGRRSSHRCIALHGVNGDAEDDCADFAGCPPSDNRAMTGRKLTSMKPWQLGVIMGAVWLAVGFATAWLLPAEMSTGEVLLMSVAVVGCWNAFAWLLRRLRERRARP